MNGCIVQPGEKGAQDGAGDISTHVPFSPGSVPLASRSPFPAETPSGIRATCPPHFNRMDLLGRRLGNELPQEGRNITFHSRCQRHWCDLPSLTNSEQWGCPFIQTLPNQNPPMPFSLLGEDERPPPKMDVSHLAECMTGKCSNTAGTSVVLEREQTRISR